EGVWGRAGPGGIEEVVGRAVPAGAIVDVGDPTTGVLLVAAGNEVAEGGERVRRAPPAVVHLEGVQPPGAVGVARGGEVDGEPSEGTPVGQRRPDGSAVTGEVGGVGGLGGEAAPR